MALVEEAHLEYAVIGGHAVNAWVEPRLTVDIDVTASADGLVELHRVLLSVGYTIERDTGAEQPSGPDFLRFVNADRSVVLEVQTAKTAFQHEIIRRALRDESGTRVATVEDLIVLKLIAYRTKDQADITALMSLPDVDWQYVEHWCRQWDIGDRLRVHREALMPP
jgi:hypothetical protein